MNDIDPNVVGDFSALVLLAGAVLLVVAITRPAGRAAISGDALRLVAIVASGAMAGSLYFSEIADFVPCEMCWFQRIAMYPIAAIGIMATIRRDRAVLPYVGVLAGLGLVASVYHIGIQLFPEQTTFCEASNPCSAKWVEGLGWMTIPQMAGTCFAVILAVSITGVRTPSKETS
jgi:disulfide bond formation protein DsbB